MDRHQRFGHLLAAPQQLANQNRQEVELVTSGFASPPPETSNSYRFGAHDGTITVGQEYARLVREQQALRYGALDDFDGSSLSGGEVVGGLSVHSGSSAPSLADFNDFTDPQSYQGEFLKAKGLVPYSVSSADSSRVSPSSHSTGFVPVRPPRRYPPQPLASLESVDNLPPGTYPISPPVDNLPPGTHRISPLPSNSAFAGWNRPAVFHSEPYNDQGQSSTQHGWKEGPDGTMIQVTNYGNNQNNWYQGQSSQQSQSAKTGITYPKKSTTGKKSAKPLKVSVYGKIPNKIKIQGPSWPPTEDVLVNFDAKNHPVEPKAPKCKNYTPIFRNIDELVKQDNRCARLYGLTHEVDDDYECNIPPETVPRVTEWLGFAFPPQLTNVLTAEFKYQKPRKCQQVVIPLLLSGYDVICRMENAAGKTMSYILPMFTIMYDRIKNGQYQPNAFNDNASHPFALIIANTRELTTQIYEQVCKCNLAFGYNVSRCIGEFDRRINVQELQRGVDIVVATPGRLRDVVESGYLQVSDLQYIVFDEADQIMSVGFFETLNPVFQKFPDLHQRQMSFFGATMETNLDLGLFLRHGYAIVANLTYKIAPRLNFYFVFVERRTRYSNFLTKYAESIMKSQDTYASKILIFMRTIDECNQIRSFMKETLTMGKVFAMNSSRNQFQRDEIMRELRNPEPTDHLIVLTTNVLSRGMDIPEVNHVIHFSVEDFDDFVNRSGRTGRLSDGYVHVLIDRDVSIPNVKQIRNSLVSIKHDVPPEVDHFINSKWNQINFV